MKKPYKRASLALAAAGMLIVAACGGGTAATTTMGMPEEGSSEYTFGEPAEAAEASQTIEITAADDLSFTPSEVNVSAGDVVTFRVINNGQLPHDFTLGDEVAQDEHEEEMSEMGGMTMPDEPNSIAIPAGETKEITWRFTEAGTVIYGCHQTGHYAAGMKGEVTVEG